MDGTIFGMYDFTNDTLVDSIHRDGGDVFIHEYTHHFISTFSSMGLLLIMMKKAFLLAPEKQWLYEELVRMMREVQEVTATNAEYYHIYETQGADAFEQARRRLNDNKEYKQYFNQLYDVHRNIGSEEDAAKLISVLVSLAIWSMNIDFSEFPLWTFQNKEDLAAFWEQPGMRERYHPSSRFHAFINYFLRDIHDETIQARVQQATECSLNGDITQHCFKIACRIYKKSNLFDRIKQRISTISVTPEKILSLDGMQGTALGAYPVDLNENQRKRKYAARNLSTCLQLLRENPDMLLVFQHLLSGLEDFAMLVCAGSRSENYLCTYTEADLPILLSMPNQIVFTRGKLFQRLRSMLPLCQKKPYILMDSAMAGNLSFIFREFENETYTYFVKGKAAILLIYNSQSTLFQPIVWEALPDARHMLKSHGIQYMEYGVSGYYGDTMLKLLLRYNQDTASDAKNMVLEFEEKALGRNTQLD